MYGYHMYSLIHNTFLVIDTSIHYYLGYYMNARSGQPSIMIMTTESQPVHYMIEAPGVGYYINGTITSGSEVVRDLPTTLRSASHNDQDKGVHVMTNSSRVTVIGQNLRSTSVDTFLVLPDADLCIMEYVYYAMSFPRGTDTFDSVVLLVGTENNTMINLTVTQSVTISVGTSTVSLTQGLQYSFVINRLQTVYIESTTEDLTGTKVVSDKPVSMLSGHQCANVPVTATNCDHLVEHIPPTTLWGKVFYSAPFGIRHSYVVKLLAAYDSTVVDFNCTVTRMSYSINEGEYISESFTQQEYCAIHSNKQVLVVQLSYSQRDDVGDGDPMMILVPATNQYKNYFQFSTLQDQSGFAHYINIIVLAQYYQPDMIYLISGGENRSLETNQWTPLLINDVTEAYTTQSRVTTGVIEVIHSNTEALMTTISYGFGDFLGYGHPGGNDIAEMFSGCYTLST